MISVRVIADTIRPDCKDNAVPTVESGWFDTVGRIITVVHVAPRWIHSEFMTHRDRARNAASSRAVSVKKSLENCLFRPMVLETEQRGMVGGEPLQGDQLAKAKELIDNHCRTTLEMVKALIELGVHKSIVNRYLEPFAYIEVVQTSTQWSNYFNLRCADDAEPHFRELAKLTREALLKSVPTVSWWHTPFVSDNEVDNNLNRMKVSSSRCAAISYLRKDYTITKELEVVETLIQKRHSSPLEHPCKAFGFPVEARSGPMRSWLTFRQIVGQMT